MPSTGLMNLNCIHSHSKRNRSNVIAENLEFHSSLTTRFSFETECILCKQIPLVVHLN